MKRYIRKADRKPKKRGKYKRSAEALRARSIRELRPAWGKDLKRKDYLFVSEYLQDLNKVQAMLRARPELKYKSAAQMAYACMKQPDVRKAIAEALSEELEVPRHRIIQELSRQAFFNPKDFMSWDEDGNVKFKPTSKLNDDQMAVVQGIHKNNSGLHIKFADKLGAIDRLSKTLGIVQDQESEAAHAPVIVNVIRFSDAPVKIPEPKGPITPVIDLKLLEAPKDVAVP